MRVITTKKNFLGRYTSESVALFQSTHVGLTLVSVVPHNRDSVECIFNESCLVAIGGHEKLTIVQMKPLPPRIVEEIEHPGRND